MLSQRPVKATTDLKSDNSIKIKSEAKYNKSTCSSKILAALSSHPKINLTEPQSLKSSLKNEEDFKNEYKELFNNLRIAAKYNRLDEIKRIKESLTTTQFYTLLKDKNSGWSDCAIIHYAVKNNHPSAIELLVSQLTIVERLAIFQLEYNTGCNALHFASCVNDSDNSGCSYEAAVAIKKFLYKADDHSFWVNLLSKQQETLDTPLLYAARQESSKLLELFSQGLDSAEWEKVLAIKNNFDRTAIEVYFINHINRLRKGKAENKFMSALRGPLTDESWVSFLISQRILYKLNEEFFDKADLKSCRDELTTGLAPHLQRLLTMNLEFNTPKIYKSSLLSAQGSLRPSTEDLPHSLEPKPSR